MTRIKIEGKNQEVEAVHVSKNANISRTHRRKESGR